jgi:DNA-binding transcriptional MerR regulator
MRGELIEQRTDAQRLSLAALSAAAGLHPTLIKQFVAYGLVEPAEAGGEALWFDLRTVRRLRAIRRLRADLGINFPGIAAVLDLLERIERLQRELDDLRDRSEGNT